MMNMRKRMTWRTEDLSEDVTSSGSWWQVWEGVGSMIQCNEQWVQLCGGSAICMSESVVSLSGGPPPIL